MEPTPPVSKPSSALLAGPAAPKVLIGIFAACAVLVAVPVIAYGAIVANRASLRPGVPYAAAAPSSQTSTAPMQPSGPASAAGGGQSMRALAGPLTAINGNRLTLQVRTGTVTLVLAAATPLFDVTPAGMLTKGTAAQLQAGEIVMARGATPQPDGTYEAKSVLFGTADALKAYLAQHAGSVPAPIPSPGA